MQKIKLKKTVSQKFPDISGDGSITKKDILMAKGVIPKKEIDMPTASRRVVAAFSIKKK